MITKRSIAIDGAVTSISLEPEFWDELERRASFNQLSWQELARQLVERGPESANRSSAIRATLLHMLKEELFHLRKLRKESWWMVKGLTATQEMGTRGSILFVGRDAANDIVIDDSEISRRHLMLCWDHECWWAIDLESKNGTIVKGKKINAIKIAIQSTISIGNSTIMLMG